MLKSVVNHTTSNVVNDLLYHPVGLSHPVEIPALGNYNYCLNLGAKVDWDFWISDLVKNPDGTNV